jgi:hypothetical protein
MLDLALLAFTVLGSKQAGFSHGMPNDPRFFPIAVWLQDPSNAAKYKAAGFNLYIGLWQGPTEAQLARLKAEGMPVLCDQNSVGLKHKNDQTIVGWTLGDEPDNAQEVKDPTTGKSGYGPCVPPANIVAEYQRKHALDPSRPIVLNLGQGVANDEWIGRGNGSSLKDYETYVKGGDIISYDIYPVAGLPKPHPEDYLWYVGKGLDRLNTWMGGNGIRWNCIECTRIGGQGKPTSDQVRSEVWMSLIHGSRGLIYFVHQFEPKFDEHALLDDPEMLSAVTALNGQIRSLAPILNSPTQTGTVSVRSSNSAVPIDVMVKQLRNAPGKVHESYLFTIGMRNGTTVGTLKLTAPTKSKTVEVLGESRSLKLTNGQFTDTFSPYQVHIYRITEAK